MGLGDWGTGGCRKLLCHCAFSAFSITRMEKIRSHFQLQVYQFARSLAIKVSGIVNILPANERFEMVLQWVRAARSVCTNIAEAWRKRRYPAAFIAKLNDAEGEAAESQTWADLAEGSGYISKQLRDEVVAEYELCSDNW